MNIKKYLLRACCVVITVVLIFSFLYVPVIAKYLSDQKSINVLVWPNVIDAEYFKEFEKETGIKVYLTYFENYEELIIKMQSGAGSYDLVMASDYAINTLIQEGLVKKLDHTKLLFWDKLYSSLFGLYCDPKNEYIIPFAWEIYGIGIDMNYFPDGMPEATWRLLFDEKISPSRLGMLDDTREVVSIAALYLFGKDVSVLTAHELKKIEDLLIKQKQRVVMYTNLRTNYILASEMAPITLGFSSDIYHAMRKYNNINFLVPQEGSFIIIDFMFLPKTTKKDDLVYAFLNYLYQPSILQKYLDRYNFFPVMTGVASNDERFLLTPTKSLFSRLRFFNYQMPEYELRNLWITLKS